MSALSGGEQLHLRIESGILSARNELSEREINPVSEKFTQSATTEPSKPELNPVSKKLTQSARN
jgi:hypothetical protein